METLATPINLIESYFDLNLNTRSLKKFDQVSEDQWIDFAKFYLDRMSLDFPRQFLGPTDGSDTVRLYFEPRMRDEWEQSVSAIYGSTPLLGLSPHPPAQNTITRDEASRMLTPLKKHLLLADSLYIRDSFYYCFDGVADSVDAMRWRSNPTLVDLVRRSIVSLKNWLPILIHLRDFIESKALVFMPYYITPSFPYGGNAPRIKKYFEKLRMRSDARKQEYFDEDTVVAAWLNARIMNLDPVFPNRAMSDWAANLYFDEGSDTNDLTSDLISVDILPFGRHEGIGLDDLWKMRKNEEVFQEIQRVVAACKQYIETNLGPGTTQEGVTATCKTFLQDQLAQYEKKSILKFIDEQPIAGIGVSLAIGAALLPVTPVVGLIVGALATPQLALLVQRRFDSKRRAFGHLQTLL
jgi:hypothetical protein